MEQSPSPESQVRNLVKCFQTSQFFYGEVLSALSPTTKLEDHPLPAGRYCLNNVFAASLHVYM